MKKTGKKQMLKGMLMALVFTFGVFAWCSDSVVSLAAGTAKVVAGSGKIRESADTQSKTLASVKKDDKLDVIAYRTDSNGYTWYKVFVNAQETGYIRSDLVTVEGNISQEKTNSSSSGNSNNSAASQTEAATEVTETDVATAKVISDVRVRKNAGTKYEVAGGAKRGTEVTVSGVATDTEGKNWYQVSFNDADKTVNGFVREDLLEVLSRVEEPAVDESVIEEAVEEEPAIEEPVVEEPAVEEPAIEEQDYYLKYMQNNEGEMDWYLFDNIQGTSRSLTQILNVVEKVKNNELKESEQVANLRLIVIALAAAAGILVVVVTVLIFKLRDAYSYEEEEGEFEDETDEIETDEEEEEDDEEVEEEPVVRKSLFGFGRRKAVIEEEEEDDEEAEEEEETLQEIPIVKPKSSQPVKTQTQAWQTKDFLELDDDMEFEFLDL